MLIEQYLKELDENDERESIEAKHKMVANFEVTNSSNDPGQLSPWL